MIAVIQRVSRASVEIDGRTVGQIKKGVLVLLGVERGDTSAEAARLAQKILLFRHFEDPAGKMNLSVMDIRGELLVVSQFTLCADTRSGRRPSFTSAAVPELAKGLYDEFLAHLRASGLAVQSGEFGAMMDVQLVNQGPVTFILDSK